MSKYVTFLILEMISKEGKPRSLITVRIKNFERSSRESAISDCIEKGYINILPRRADGRGRVPFYVSITPVGLDAFNSMVEEGMGSSGATVWGS